MIWMSPQLKVETNLPQRSISKHSKVPDVQQQRSPCSCPGIVLFDKWPEHHVKFSVHAFLKTKTITSCFLGLNFMTYTSLKKKDTNKAYLHHQRNGKLWSHYAIILVWWSDYDFWMSGIAFGQMSHALILETYYRTHNLAISQPNSLFINFYGMI